MGYPRFFVGNSGNGFDGGGDGNTHDLAAGFGSGIMNGTRTPWAWRDYGATRDNKWHPYTMGNGVYGATRDNKWHPYTIWERVYGNGAFVYGLFPSQPVGNAGVGVPFINPCGPTYPSE